MRFIYTVRIDEDNNAASCPTIIDCKRFIRDFQRHDKTIHRFSIYNEETGTIIKINIKENITMKKQELFEKAVKAMDNYTKAVEMGLSDFANYYHSQMKTLCNEIRHRGLKQEFDDFALVF